MFTLPQQIATIAYQNKRELYAILFRATAETLLTIAADPKRLGGEIGFFAVLHTWGQNLLHHPPALCCLRRWSLCGWQPMDFLRAGFFLPVGVLSRLFRRLFLEYLLKAFDACKLEFFSSLESLRDRSSFLDYLAPLREAEGVEHIIGQVLRDNQAMLKVCKKLGFAMRYDSFAEIVEAKIKLTSDAKHCCQK